MSDEINPDIGPDGWDKEAIYDTEISPLMAQIIAICQREKIPMLASFIYRASDDTGDGVESACTTHLPGSGEKFNEATTRAVAALKQSNLACAFTLINGA